MIYYDRVYGKFRITEPVILKLISSPSLQRLKGVDQAGYRPLWVKPEQKMGKYDHSRYAHSLGVYLLLKKYNAPLEEQVAGLIHDVSHSAFSHSIDYVLAAGSPKMHNHQDNIFESFVKKSEIPKILNKYGFRLDYILNDKNFPLKEKKLPDLCADRIDYSLRDAVLFNEITRKQVKNILNNLTTENSNWLFKNYTSAKKFAKLFYKLNTIYYAGFPTAIMFRTVGDYLLYSLQKNYISKNDLYTTDKQIIEKINKFFNIDKKLRLLSDRMNNKINYKNNPKHYDAKVYCKSRIVDPMFKTKEGIKRVSNINKKWKDIVKQELKPKIYFIKFNR